MGDGRGTHYDALGLSPHSSADQIRDRYWELLPVVHPSAPTGDRYLFKALTEAYSVLANPTTRRAYDISLEVSVGHGTHLPARPSADRVVAPPKPPKTDRWDESTGKPPKEPVEVWRWAALAGIVFIVLGLLAAGATFKDAGQAVYLFSTIVNLVVGLATSFWAAVTRHSQKGMPPGSRPPG